MLLIDIVRKICSNVLLQHYNNLCWKEQEKNAIKTLLIICPSYYPWIPSFLVIAFLLVLKPLWCLCYILTCLVMMIIPGSLNAVYKWTESPDLPPLPCRLTYSVFWQSWIHAPQLPVENQSVHSVISTDNASQFFCLLKNEMLLTFLLNSHFSALCIDI